MEFLLRRNQVDVETIRIIAEKLKIKCVIKANELMVLVKVDKSEIFENELKRFLS